MFEDPFYDIMSSEAFSKSQCMTHERRLVELFQSLLECRGYVPDDDSRRVWRRGFKRVVVCLADDYNVCGADHSESPERWFDADTTIITDNHITFSPEYCVLQLPQTYFGMFYYQPDDMPWQPQRRFNFSVNRMDTQRQQILFEMIQQSGGLDLWLDQDFVNFNAWDANGANQTSRDLKNNFARYWQGPRPQCYDQVVDHLPIRNHRLSIEQAHTMAWINVVIETYAGDVTHAFSEKIFRALVTPAPWVVFSARGAVEYLEQLGFDVLGDVISHSYDGLLHENKIPRFIQSAILDHTRVVSMDQQRLRARCIKAATHNRAVLQEMRQNWPGDFAKWLPSIVNRLR